MTIKEKLELIQKNTGLSQTELSQKLGVSYVSFSKWWNGHSLPREKSLNLIDSLYLEVTGQKIIPEDYLVAKKQNLLTYSKKYKNIVEKIISNVDIRDQLMLKLTYHSNSIEGSTLTENDTAAILFDNVALPNKTLIEQLEAKNHQTALSYLFNHLVRGGDIDENLILKLHGILMSGIYDDAGFYRRHSVRIVGANVPTANYLKIQEMMNVLVVKIKEDTNDPIAHTSVIHSEFEKIHPFPDGNGRIGRLLMNAMLLKNNFAPAIIHQENKQRYYTYLNKSQIKGDNSQLEDFVCDAVLDGFNILERKIN
jgi:Fic family protein